MTFNKKRIIALLTMLAMIVIYLPAYATDHQENVCLYQFDTVSLENISGDNATIYLDGYYEAVVYAENGNFSTCSQLKNITDYSDNLKLAPNEKIIISCDGGAYLNLTYPSDSILFKKEAKNCYETRILLSENTYSLKNITGDAMPLFGVDDVPYVLYDENGNITEYDVNSKWGKGGNRILPGYTIKLQLCYSVASQKISYVEGSFLFETENEQIYDVTSFFEGDGYSFKNITDQSVTFFSQGGERDYRIYDNNNNLVEEGIRADWNLDSSYVGYDKKEIPSGYTIELYLTHQIDILSPCGCFDIKKSDNIKATRVIINKGETYSFTNITNKIHSLKYDLNPSDYVDYAIYDEDNNIVFESIKCNLENMTVNPGNTIKITPRNESLEIAVFEDEFQFKRDSLPVFLRTIIRYDETYSFENNSSTEQTIMGDLYGEYKIYDLNGNIAGSSDGANIDGLKVPKGYTVYITSKKDAAECVVLNEYFIIKKVSNPENVEYLDIAYGKTYKITNNSASYYYFLNNNCDFTMDIAAYYSDDKTCPVGNTTQNAFSISGGGYVYVRFYVNTSIYNSPTLTIEEMDTPILEKVELTPGKIYSFENLNNKYSNSIICGTLNDNLQIYDCNASASRNSYQTKLIDQTLVVRVVKYYSTAIFDSTKIKCTEQSDIDISIVEYSRGDNVRMTNTSNDTRYIDAEGDHMTCVQYDSTNAAKTIHQGNGFQASWTLNPGEYVDFVSTGRNRFIYPNGYANFEKLDKYPFVYHSVSVGDTVLVKAGSSKNTTFRIIAQNFDYVKYTENNQITEFDPDHLTESHTQDILLYAGESIEITPTNAPITIMLADDEVTVEKQSNPTFERKHLAPGEKYVFTNPLEVPVRIYPYFYSGNTYTLYDKSLNIIKENKVLNYNACEIQPGYKIEITINESIPNIIALPYKISHFEDFTVKVTGISISQSYLTLGQGESKTLTATIIPSDAVNKNIIWSSSDTSIATVSLNGVVKGINYGNTKISATSEDGNFVATCDVAVIDLSVKGVALSENFVVMKVGEKKMLQANVLPIFASDKSIKWRANTKYGVNVSQTGELTAISSGNVIIYAETPDRKYSASCNVIVLPEDKDTPNWISATSATATPGEQVSVPIKIYGNTGIDTIYVPIYYDNTALTLKSARVGNKSYTALFDSSSYSSYPFEFGVMMSNAKLIEGTEYTLATLNFEVSPNAKSGDYPIALYVGEESIMDSDCNDIPYNSIIGTIKIVAPDKSIIVNKTELNLSEGQKETVTANVVNGDGSEKLIWGSSDYDVAAVVNGTIVAISSGVATITVTTDDYKTYTTLNVVVKKGSQASIDDITVIQNGTAADVTLSAQNIPQCAVVFAGVYSSAKKLISFDILELDKNGNYIGNVDISGGVTIKAFAFENIFNIKPVCSSKEKTLN